jgi:hypothetical protein
MTGTDPPGNRQEVSGRRDLRPFQTGIPADSLAAACRKDLRTDFYRSRTRCVEYWVSPLLSFACVGLFFWLTLRANQEGATGG